MWKTIKVLCRVAKAILFESPVPKRAATKCRECGELVLIPHLDNNGVCRKCHDFAAMLAET